MMSKATSNQMTQKAIHLVSYPKTKSKNPKLRGTTSSILKLKMTDQECPLKPMSKKLCKRKKRVISIEQMPKMKKDRSTIR